MGGEPTRKSSIAPEKDDLSYRHEGAARSVPRRTADVAAVRSDRALACRLEPTGHVSHAGQMRAEGEWDPHRFGSPAPRCGRHRARSTSLTCSSRPGPEEPRPRHAIKQARAWARGEITMSQARTAAGHANAVARDLSGAARHATHELCAAAYWAQGRTGCRAGRSGRQRGAPRVPVASAASSRRRFASSSPATSGCANDICCSMPDRRERRQGASTASERRPLTEVMRSADGRSEPPGRRSWGT
jgi:hypothetical protein